MPSPLAKAALIAGLLLPGCGCASVWQDEPPPPPPPAPVQVDPFVTIRPTTASVGVVMPDAADFPHPWDASTYILRVTQFGVMPPLNGGVAFVGDSLTDWMRWNELFPEIRSRNFGIAGDTTVGLKARINQVIAAKPSKVVLQIGTNDVEYGRYPPDQIVAHIAASIDALRDGVPGVTIYVENLLPRQPQYDEKVRAVNALIKDAADRRGLTLIDVYSRFVVGGRLDPTVTPDDLHLSGQGYLRWRDLLRPYIGTN